MTRRTRSVTTSLPHPGQHDEWDSADRRYFSDASMALLNTTAEEDSTPELIAA